MGTDTSTFNDTPGCPSEDRDWSPPGISMESIFN